MDEAGVFRKDLIRQFFELGLMGIEIPEEYGGQGGSFFQCDPGDRRALGGRSLGRRDRRRAEHHRQQRHAALGATTSRSSSICRGWPTDTVASYALSEAGSGSDAFALATTRRGSTATTSCSPAASSGSPTPPKPGFFLLFANANPEAGYKGITAFLIERDFPGFQVGKKEDKLGHCAPPPPAN